MVFQTTLVRLIKVKCLGPTTKSRDLGANPAEPAPLDPWPRAGYPRLPAFATRHGM